MSNARPKKTEIRRAIELLTKVTQRDNLQDHDSMIEAQRQFKTLRDELPHSDQHPVAAFLCSIGERLVGHMHKGKPVSTDELRPLVNELAEHVTKQIVFRIEPKTLVGKPASKHAKNELRLSLRDGQRLGELLVRMTMLSPTQVEEAVEIQRATGQRLGEALLQMRLLTPEMLESVLRIQKTKRTSTTHPDPWSAYKGPAA